MAYSIVTSTVVLFSLWAGIVYAQTSASASSASGSTVLASSETTAPAASATSATDPSSTYSQSDVPTGTPLPGNYAGPLRPQVHFSPPIGFMNDPNGMFIDQDGLYHLYYQCDYSTSITFETLDDKSNR